MSKSSWRIKVEEAILSDINILVSKLMNFTGPSEAFDDCTVYCMDKVLNHTYTEPSLSAVSREMNG